MIVALYARESVDERLSGTGLYTQITELKRKAEFEKWQVYRLYTDEAKSGTTDDGREGLNQMILDAKAGKFNAVAITKLDRFFRNIRLLLNYIDELDKLVIRLISIGEGLDTSNPNGRFTIHILGVIAEWERERIIERTKKGRYARYAQHQWAAGQPIYGYDYNPNTKMLDINETEARIVRRIYELYVYDRMGLQQIARLLNTEQVKPRQQAKQWHKGAINQVISHPGYKGEHPKGVHLLPIIEIDLWEMAQQRRQDNPHLHRRKESPWLLQGLIKCGLCGQTLACNYSHGKSGRRVYSCRGRLLTSHPDDSHRCALNIIDATYLEEKIIESIGNVFSHPEKLEILLTETIDRMKSHEAELNANIKPINTQLSEIEEQRKRLAENWVKKALGEDDINERLFELNQKEERLLNVKQEIDPDQIKELEQTRLMLGLWDAELKAIKTNYSSFDNAISSITDSLKPLMTISMITSMSYQLGVAEEVSQKMIWPMTWRQAMERLQVKLIAFDDRVEIKAVFATPTVKLQESQSVSRILPCRGRYLSK